MRLVIIRFTSVLLGATAFLFMVADETSVDVLQKLVLFLLGVLAAAILGGIFRTVVMFYHDDGHEGRESRQIVRLHVLEWNDTHNVN